MARVQHQRLSDYEAGRLRALLLAAVQGGPATYAAIARAADLSYSTVWHFANWATPIGRDKAQRLLAALEGEAWLSSER